MNICILSGKLQQRPVVLGEGKAIKFTLLTRHRYGGAEVKEGVASVPCTIFNASEQLKQFLLNEKAMYCKGIGRISRSKYEDKDGNVVYSTEVILNPESVMIRTG